MFKVNESKLNLLAEEGYENTVGSTWYKVIDSVDDMDFEIIFNPIHDIEKVVINVNGTNLDLDLDTSMSLFKIYKEINRLIEIGVIEVIE